MFLHTYVFAKNPTELFDGINILVANYGVQCAIKNAPRAQQGQGNYQMGLAALQALIPGTTERSTSLVGRHSEIRAAALHPTS